VRATLAAYLPQDQSWPNLIHDQLERRFSKLVFVQHFLRGDREIAAKIGVDIRPDDYVVGSMIGAGLALQVKAFQIAETIPVVRDVATAFLTWRVEQLISAYGHAKFTTDASKYRPTAAAA